MRDSELSPEHRDFRDMVRAFVEREIVPFHADWERAGLVDREVWRSAGKHGLLGIDVPEEYGGGGVRDFRYQAIISEEIMRVGATGVGFALHNDVVAPYLLDLATEEQKRRWLPGFCSGELVTAIAMTEPEAGSDLQAVRTSARLDGEHYVLSGAKTFITNGIHADLVIVVARTGPGRGARGLSLLVVERGMAGFERGRKLEKIGMAAQDTAELFFDEVRVPVTNLLGRAGRGFLHLANNLPQERLGIAAYAVAAAETAFAQTLEYCKSRTQFGRAIGGFQHVRFELAEMATELDVARTYVDRAVAEHNAGRLDAVDAAKAKWWATDVQRRVLDRCVQLHGGYGFMRETPVARAFVDNRVHPIYGGTNEIMKEIIGRDLGV
ncbi:acyl-CoA dehydrogenase family protein [Streptomyces xanthophaeus]|uniref:Acyl-CoA dehydrogenase FadE20 n=1 Tax=Streptomyces xanthophaeus TaxID=67385 RepID=A0A919GZG7_9ACTN|nr:acyl-CoA dehydrogenase family protein [Streptomyces xanthophaeus]WCD89802.1 Acyl-CoA dehydrogenase [Streptomyces xanthophaeus]GHI86197.1 acyl-CoA dehydrogenase FadE20 [Streptomyces xanthophaeus]